MTKTDFTYNPESKTWAGPIIPYPYGTAGIGELMLENMKGNLNFVCQISDDSGEIYTYERMLNAAISFAEALKERGVRKGDHVLFYMDNHHYLAATWLGCIFSGAILCPFIVSEGTSQGELCHSFSYKEKNLMKFCLLIDEVQFLIEQLKPKLMVTSMPDQITLFENIFQNLTMDCPIYMYENKIPGCHDLKPLLEKKVDIYGFQVPKIKDPAKELLMLTLSSSTTGTAKIIKNTHMQLISIM